MPGCSPARPVPLSPRTVSSPSLLCREENAQSWGRSPGGLHTQPCPGRGGCSTGFGEGQGTASHGDTGDSGRWKTNAQGPDGCGGKESLPSVI